MNLKKIVSLFFLLGIFFSGFDLRAQSEVDDQYDPFADYSEFEETSDEEADVNFFRNGRFFNMGFFLGQKSFTENMSMLYGPSTEFGIFFTYFFDLRFALQYSYHTSGHSYYVKSDAGELSGSSNWTSHSFHIKYYMNTQNVTRGLADLNPYLLLGFSSTNRSFQGGSSETTASSAKDSGFSGDLGAGIEIPMMKKTMYFGTELIYQMVQFPDEGIPILIDGISTHFRPYGDMWHLDLLLGINF